MSLSNASFTVRGQAARALRVARGVADPASRPRYVAAIKRRLVSASAGGAAARGGERCLVCSGSVSHRTLRFTRNPSRIAELSICRRCGFIRNHTNYESKYEGMSEVADLSPSTRAGSYERPGREYHIAKMATQILGRDSLEVLVYGAGRSFDNHHIQTLPQVRNVVIGDIINVRDDAEFIDANKPPPRRFEVVVASEVIEHFRDPRPDFVKLLRLVRRDGLLICGTNIYAGGNLARDPYIFYQDHTAYYTPPALREIARSAGFHLDFRTPKIGTAMRKRYVLFSRSAKVMQDAACYFGTQAYAPSEKDAERVAAQKAARPAARPRKKATGQPT